MSEKITADDIKKALENQYCSPEWYLGFEVGNSCGSLVERHADAIAINAYPSKDFEVRGFEIKVSRNDLKKELDCAAKSDALYKYCNYWYLVVPKGLTEGFQIPNNWGLIEYLDGKTRIKKPAIYSKNTIDYGFVCAFIRGWERRNSFDRQQIYMQESERAKKDAMYFSDRDKKDFEKLKEVLSKIHKKTGVYISSHGISEREMALIKIAMGMEQNQYKIADLEHYLQKITKASEELKSSFEKMSNLIKGEIL